MSLTPDKITEVNFCDITSRIDIFSEFHLIQHILNLQTKGGTEGGREGRRGKEELLKQPLLWWHYLLFGRVEADSSHDVWHVIQTQGGGHLSALRGGGALAAGEGGGSEGGGGCCTRLTRPSDLLICA